MLLRRSVKASPSFTNASPCIFSPLLGAALGLHTNAIAAAMAVNDVGQTSREPAFPAEDKKKMEENSEALNGKDLGSLAEGIMPHILNLYCLKATAADYEIYKADATFEDPLMKAKGVKQIKSAFYSMPKIFSEGNLGEYSVNETEIKSGFGEIRIDNMQHYKVMGKAIDMRSLIKLQIEDGKVIKHEDLWDKHPLWSRDTVKVPLVGRTVEGWRRLNMLITHSLMGFGKDPKP